MHHRPQQTRHGIRYWLPRDLVCFMHHSSTPAQIQVVHTVASQQLVFKKHSPTNGLSISSNSAWHQSQMSSRCCFVITFAGFLRPFISCRHCCRLSSGVVPTMMWLLVHVFVAFLLFFGISSAWRIVILLLLTYNPTD